MRSSTTALFGGSRSADAPDYLFTEQFAVDRRDPARIRELVHGHRIDVIIDVIAYELTETALLLAEIEDEVSRYVLISSSDVYKTYGLLHRKETGDRQRNHDDETSPLRTSRFPYRGEHSRASDDPQRFLDDYDKIPIEQAVRRLACEWTILRLPMVYGPGDKQHRFRWAIEPMSEGEATLTVPERWARWVTTYGYIDDVAAGVALAACHSDARNEIYNLGELNPVDHETWVSRFADAIGWTGKFATGAESTDFTRRIQSLDLGIPFRVTTHKIRQALNYREPTPVSDALRRTVEFEVRGKVVS